jgi:protein-L-isoaspartate(D-aspartate) O-methyltransferase
VRAASWAAISLLLVFCAGATENPKPEETGETGFEAARFRMVREDISRRGVSDPAVLGALRSVPRHRFMRESLAAQAYADRPLPIAHGQTISQPYIVALMTQLAELEPGDRVLEVGTGSGYQAAVIAEIVEQVYSIEILEELSRSATSLLGSLGYDNIRTRVGDGYRGWPEEAPFDAILVTAAPPQIPQPLIDQLAVGARLVIPVGRNFQELIVIERTADGLRRHRSIPVRFVPMTGEAQRDR